MEWRKNLYHLEEQPPEQSWDLISKELEDDIPAIRLKFQDLDSSPPPAVWEAVVNELDKTTKSKVAPVKWYQKSWNILAAAVFAAVVFGVLYININKFDAAGISTAVINPIPDSNSNTGSVQPAPQQEPSVLDLTAEQASLKDNNYLYFTSVNGETKRLSYKLKTFLPALKNKKHHVVLDQWTSTLENSTLVPSGNNFFDIVEMVKLVEQKQK